MRWSERQQAMLREMGIRLWEREVASQGSALTTGPDVGERRVAGALASVAVAEPAVAFAARPAPAASPAPAAPAELAPADWLVVAEPLDGGGAGLEAQLLDNMLRAIGVARAAPTRAGRAAVLALADGPPGAGAAADDAMRSERLRDAVVAVRPGCILALGRSAARALLASDEPLGSLRGRRHAHAGVPVVVTCPLAFLLRHPDEKERVWADLCLAVEAADEARAEVQPLSP